MPLSCPQPANICENLTIVSEATYKTTTTTVAEPSGNGTAAGTTVTTTVTTQAGGRCDTTTTTVAQPGASDAAAAVLGREEYLQKHYPRAPEDVTTEWLAQLLETKLTGHSVIKVLEAGVTSQSDGRPQSCPQQSSSPLREHAMHACGAHQFARAAAAARVRWRRFERRGTR